MNTKIKKIISVVVAMALVCAVSVASTLALLKAESNSVTNTFVPTPTLMDDNSKFTLTADVSLNVIPLQSITPTAKMSTGKFLTDGVVYLEVVETDTDNIIEYTIDANWKELTGKTGKYGGQLYVYKPSSYVVAKETTLSNVAIFSGNITVSDYETATETPTIKLYGYAVQSLYKADQTVVSDDATAYEAWNIVWGA